MFNNATVCIALGIILICKEICFADGTVPETARVENGPKLTRVELFPAGQGFLNTNPLKLAMRSSCCR